jgi:hypothetical protein
VFILSDPRCKISVYKKVVGRTSSFLNPVHGS